MNQISASQFPEVYASLGINTDDLGCIMLDLDTIDLSKYLYEDYADDLYYSPSQEFTQGDVVGHKAHITLLYGLLQHGSLIEPLVDTVLSGWKQPSKVKIESIGVFPGKEDDGTKYSCIVAHMDPTALVEANSRLRLLPHIDTFPEYKAHMTLAYVKPEATTEWVESLEALSGKLVSSAGLNYGK